MNNRISLFIMGQHGLAVLKTLLDKIQNSVQLVVSARNVAVLNDYYEEIKLLCDNYNIEFVDRKDFTGTSTLYAVAVSWRWILDLNSTKLIVLHDSILPRLRGFNPLVTALINGDEVIGVTALFADKEYDKGDIIYQEKIDITHPIFIKDAQDKLSVLYQKIVVQIVKSLLDGDSITGTIQNEALATYSLWRNENDYHIDWSLSSYKLQRFIYAVNNPYKGAYTIVNGKRYRILDALPIEDKIIENRDIGKIIFINDGFPVVVCGQGLLKIKIMIDELTGASVIPWIKMRIRFS